MAKSENNVSVPQCNLHVITDDINNYEMFKKLFEPLHFIVYHYPNSLLLLYTPADHRSGCIIVDVKYTKTEALVVVEALNQAKIQLPIVVIADEGDITTAIKVMKLGARDFIVKPFHEQSLIENIQNLINQQGIQQFDSELLTRIQLLTKREHEIMQLIVAGHLNKVVADKLGISVSTVEAHRSKIMTKMNVKNKAQLLKYYIKATWHNDYVL